MQRRYLAYTAGTVSGKTFDDSMRWTVDFQSQLQLICNKTYKPNLIDLVSPLRGKDGLKADGILSDSYEDKLMSNQKAVIARDEFDVHRCDLLVAYLYDAPKVSIGTCMEIAWMHRLRKPIIVIMDKGGLHDHCFIRELAGWIVEDVETAAKIAIAICQP